MEKAILLSTFACAFLATAICILIDSRTSESELLIQNVEALAAGEDGDIVICEEPWDPVCTTLGDYIRMGTKQ